MFSPNDKFQYPLRFSPRVIKAAGGKKNAGNECFPPALGGAWIIIPNEIAACIFDETVSTASEIFQRM